MFLLPVDLRRGCFLLSWRQTAEIRWDVLTLFVEAARSRGHRPHRFMLPVATPPTAVILASGAVETRHMFRAGAILDIGILAVTAAVLLLGGWLAPSA